MRITTKVLSGAAVSAIALALIVATGEVAQASSAITVSQTEQLAAVVDHASGVPTGDTIAPAHLSAGVKVGDLTIRPVAADREAIRSNGRAYYKNSHSSTTTVLQGSGTEAQIMTVLGGRKSPRSFGYDLTVPADVAKAIQSDGSISLTKKNGNVTELVGVIDAPWAKDANGKSLPTKFELDGDRLTQYIDTTNAAYPVVADPKITYGFPANVYFNMTGAEGVAVIDTITTIGGVASIASCAGLANLPVWVTKVLKLLCPLIPIATIKGVLSAYQSVYNAMKNDLGACFQQKILPSRGPVVKVNISNCV